MDTHCLRLDQLPGSSRLILDYSYQFQNLTSFYRYPPYHPESLAQAARAVQYPSDRRERIHTALASQNPGNPLLARFRQQDAVVVATGQQVGYLGGPAYTVYKALTAIHVAKQLENHGIPAVPVFWLASEDHDLAEVDHAWLFDSQRKPLRHQAERVESGNAPVGNRIAPGIDAEALASVFAHLPFGEQIASLAADVYDGRRTYTQSFRVLVERILGERRILFLDPLDPAIRNASAPLLAEAVRHFTQLSQEVHSRTESIHAAGYHAQVHLESDTSFFFLLDNGERLSLKARAGSFSTGKRTFTAAELADRATAISPNALLRPVLQDYLLPTACLVGGPAEIAYLAQCRPLYDALLGRQPVFLPRSGFTLFDEHAARRAASYQLRMADFFVPETDFVERLAHTRIPPALLGQMERISGQAAHLLDEMRRDLLGFDPTLARASERSQKRVLYQFQKMERKTAREIARREERVSEDAAYLRGLVFPEKHLQERLYSILPFLAVHGMGLIDTVAAQVHENCPDHHVLVV
ncbi:MAG: bacillithiol biosynthesis cysteine-adding enzyme BshC [Bryobacterales bacterium]|nr:bacillithiol biosynthesis cysteine-adding enzyme BshC [Bryobacterales bacterium]